MLQDTASTTGSIAEKRSVSIYYSHTLGLLFYTYPSGKSYVGTLEDLNAPSPLTRGVLITPGVASKSTSLGLTGWTEVLGHPGLIFAMAGSELECEEFKFIIPRIVNFVPDSAPYVLLFTGNGSLIQEIRLPAKLKALDMVPIRHAASPGNAKIKTSLLVCLGCNLGF